VRLSPSPLLRIAGSPLTLPTHHWDAQVWLLGQTLDCHIEPPNKPATGTQIEPNAALAACSTCILTISGTVGIADLPSFVGCEKDMLGTHKGVPFIVLSINRTDGDAGTGLTAPTMSDGLDI
jgi:hypothetical protein